MTELRRFHEDAADTRHGALSRLVLVWLVLTSAALGGCHGPKATDAASITDPALSEIVNAYKDAVRRAHDDPDVDWHAGWLGNLWVNFSGRRDAGLCWEWRDLVDGAVRPAAKAHGWEVLGIHVFRGTPSEHNAVVVFDPRQVRRDTLLPKDSRGDLLRRAGPPAAAWVLDPWRSGKARVYALDEWVAEARRRRWPVGLEDPPFAVGGRTYGEP